MRKREPLALGEEAHAVLSDDAAAAQDGETDLAGRALAGDAGEGKHCHLIQPDAAPARRRLPQHQCRARRRVDLEAVMCFENLDVAGLGSSTSFLTEYLAVKNGLKLGECTSVPVGAAITFIAAM